MVVISVKPEVFFADEPISVRVSGLRPYQLVTLVSALRADNGKEFYSYAFYKASAQGDVDVGKDSSTGGFYTGIEPMGLFWSMWCSTLAFMKKIDVTTPDNIQLSVLDGHQNLGRNWTAGSEVALTTREIKRCYLGENMEREVVNIGELMGVVFSPKSDKKLPAVIDVSGVFGGVLEQRAVLLARRGFVVFCVSLFGMEGQSVHPSVLDLEILDKAIDFLYSKENVRDCGAGIIGLSFGGTVALAAVGCIDRITCAVNVTGSVVNVKKTDLTYKGKVWQYFNIDLDAFVVYKGVRHIKGAWSHPDVDDMRIYMPDFHKSPATILSIYGTSDQSFEWEKSAEIINAMMKKSGKRNSKILTYSEAGHIILPPYTPHSDTVKFIHHDHPVAVGGKSKQHNEAQEKSWREVIRFFQKNLCSNLPSNL